MVYIQAAALLSALSKADPAGIGTRADMSTLVVNRNQAKRVSAMDNKIDYDSILTKYTKKEHDSCKLHHQCKNNWLY